MTLGTEVCLDPSYIVSDGDPASSSPIKKQSPQFHVYCAQTAAWINMPLGMKVDLGPGRIALHGNPAPSSQKGHSPRHNFRTMSIVDKRSPISATCEHLSKFFQNVSVHYFMKYLACFQLSLALSALTLLTGWQEGHLACKN